MNDSRASHAPASAVSGTRRVVFAATLGTAFEWYDFFLYGTVAQVLAANFFPAGNSVASFLLVLATFGAGFAVRPLGALLFGTLGDRSGRKHTFLITIILMGAATAAIGLLPVYASAGIWAPILLVTLRLLQGLALGGEYGGAAIYVAEHAPPGKRGYYTSWIQLSGVGGFLLALVVVLSVSAFVGEQAWSEWGWRIPFLLSLLMMGISVYIRLQLHETPVFEAMKSQGQLSRSPLRETLGKRANLRLIFIALFGVSGGQTVVWFTAQFSSLFLLQQWAGLGETQTKVLLAVATLIGAPVFVFSGWLSDRIGRRRTLLIAYGGTLLLMAPLFFGLAYVANPGRSLAADHSPVVVSGSDCEYSVFAGKQSGACGKVLAFLSGKGITFSVNRTTGEGPLDVRVGSERFSEPDLPGLERALKKSGYMSAPTVNLSRGLLIITIVIALVLLAGMTYGPSAAVLTELFPARIRYTSLSLPYHLATGYLGGFQPFIAQYIVVRTGNPFGGLVYTLGVVAVALCVCTFMLTETRNRDISE